MKRILVANRGEIACRVIRAAKKLGLEAVAVYSDADAEAMHVEMADASVHIGPPAATESYLRQDAILAAAQETGADAIHPGYGFMAENADFARAVMDAGLIWVGPRPETIEAMGDKQRARDLAKKAGVPVARGSDRLLPGKLDGLEQMAETVGYPLLVKAAAGGGGIGMRRVDSPETLRKTVEATQSMAERSFGDGSVYLERFIPKARHIEIQVFGFGDGRAVHLFERDCSLQRRFQKIIEESPAPGFSSEAVAGMAEAARALAASQNYTGAGTVEYVADAETGEYFFLEMNTRIQVEHPVTEMVTGCDLVGLQLRLAAGEEFYDTLSAVSHNGAAVECRLYAENPAKNFLPSPGTLDTFDLPDDIPGIRVDAGVRVGDAITPYYDPMIAKIIAWGEDRATAIERLRSALETTRIEGPKTNRDFLIAVLGDPEFKAGAIWTGFVEERRKSLIG
ncbi:biotin carboxylase N-terminal domain-containing protein [uncultured Sulfitobacter sp.]|uniref:acetyl-CoA carboxylase biotin carboxylase subunit n=1 Tax=uncultured Sulfitobacter sp. TaxID=191468 RepID=UPI00261AF1DA|nr:biotin carboxylase N-terminal domain-containing protein [uncultured Sulfitobacter sp.]